MPWWKKPLQGKLWSCTDWPALNSLPVVTHHSLTQELKVSHQILEFLPQSAGDGCPGAVSRGAWLTAGHAPIGSVCSVQIFKLCFERPRNLGDLSNVSIHSISENWHRLRLVQHLALLVHSLYLGQKLFDSFHLGFHLPDLLEELCRISSSSSQDFHLSLASCRRRLHIIIIIPSERIPLQTHVIPAALLPEWLWKKIIHDEPTAGFFSLKQGIW